MIADKKTPDYVWKIKIMNRHLGIRKKKYYEREQDFIRWLAIHIKEYPEHTVHGFIHKDNEWQRVE